MSKNTTQKQQVLAHLQKRKSITSWEAIEKYGITRLAHYIYLLKDHYVITTITERGEDSKWAKYIYGGQK